MEIKIKFMVNDMAQVCQTIKLKNDRLTKSEIMEGLKSGDIVTTINPQGKVNDVIHLTKQAINSVGAVVEQDIETEFMTYSDFELDC